MGENISLRVLMVEDNPGDAFLVSERLSDVPGYSFEISHVATLQDAIEVLNKSSIDAVLLDLNLPDSTGIDTVRRLRSIREDVAVVVLSSNNTEETYRLALREGAYDFIGKDDPPARLLARSILFALERHRAQESQRQIKKLVSANPDAVVVVDMEGIVQFVNEAALKLFGRSQEDFVGESLGFSFKEGASSEIDILKNGERRSAEIHVARIEWNWKPAFLASIRDTTDQKRLAEQFREAQKMEAIGQLAGGIAHDFNNLLCVIMGFGLLMKREIPPESPHIHYLDEILGAGERATALVRQLLAFGRRQLIQPRVVDLNLAVRDMENLLKRVIGEDINLISSFSDQPCYVYIDPAQAEQVIMNLAVNARDAMPHGGYLKFETAITHLDEDYVRNHPEMRPGPYVLLTISDTGQGMDKETLSHIFEPFFTTKEVGKGTGLGLATVYGIVKQLKGHIWVYSEPGFGTSFKIYFPEAPEPPPSSQEEIIEIVKPLGLETILLVEDNKSVRELGCRLLEKAGYTVLTAVDGNEAIIKSQEYKGSIHLLVTDIVMPEMSGARLAEALSKERPDMRILFVSGYPLDINIREGVIAPEMPFLEKPFTGDTLHSKIREILDGPEPDR